MTCNETRRFSYEPTWMLRAMEELHIQFDPCPEEAGGQRMPGSPLTAARTHVYVDTWKSDYLMSR